jgi:hypothetical protein
MCEHYCFLVPSSNLLELATQKQHRHCQFLGHPPRFHRVTDLEHIALSDVAAFLFEHRVHVYVGVVHLCVFMFYPQLGTLCAELVGMLYCVMDM